MRILFIGDVVGRSGREAVATSLPRLREALRIDLAVVNAENASQASAWPRHGERAVRRRRRCDHAGQPRVGPQGDHPHRRSTRGCSAPLKFPPGTPGGWLGRGRGPRRAPCAGGTGDGAALHGSARLSVPRRRRIAVAYRLGGTIAAIFVDFHAEASSQKMAFGHFLDGQVSAVVGTHTHCPSADAQVLPGGRRSSRMPDVGRLRQRDRDGEGRRDAAVLAEDAGRAAAPAEGETTVCGAFVETDDATGLARRIEPVRVGGRLAEAMPSG